MSQREDVLLLRDMLEHARLAHDAARASSDLISTAIESSAPPVNGLLRSLARLLQTFPLPSKRAMMTSPGTRS